MADAEPTTEPDVAERRVVRRRRVPGGRGNRNNVRLTDAEQRLVKQAAAAAGLTAPNLIAETVLLSLTGRGQLGVAERRALAVELAGVRSLLAKIGVNVNQLAAAANSGAVPAAGEVEATMDAVARMVARLDAVIAPLEGRPGGDRR